MYISFGTLLLLIFLFGPARGRISDGEMNVILWLLSLPFRIAYFFYKIAAEVVRELRTENTQAKECKKLAKEQKRKKEEEEADAVWKEYLKSNRDR